MKKIWLLVFLFVVGTKRSKLLFGCLCKEGFLRVSTLTAQFVILLVF